MKIKFYKEEDPTILISSLNEFQKDNFVGGILILACDNNNVKQEEIDPILSAVKKPLFGAIFPGLIFDNKKHESGYIIAGIPARVEIVCIEHYSCRDTSFEEHLFSGLEKFQNIQTIFTFLDSFSRRITELIESVFTTYGLEFNFIGGGAGSLSMEHKPCIITNDGLKQDCVLLAGVNLASGIGVQHGWEYLSGPYKVTSSDENTILELDFKPAYTVYKQVVEKYSGKSLNKENFYSYARAYPFGINKIDSEKVVRDPILVEDGDKLVCVGAVEQGLFVDILSGTNSSLIAAAGKAVRMALTNKGSEAEHFIFFVDCISRVLFLEDEFEKELEEVTNIPGSLPVFGILSIGEIANNGRDYLEFYNKTSVIGCF